MSSQGSASDLDDNDDDVSEKLVKQISASINSFELEKFSNNEKTGQPEEDQPIKAAQAALAAPSVGEISSFSDSSVV